MDVAAIARMPPAALQRLLGMFGFKGVKFEHREVPMTARVEELKALHALMGRTDVVMYTCQVEHDGKRATLAVFCLPPG